MIQSSSWVKLAPVKRRVSQASAHLARRPIQPLTTVRISSRARALPEVPHFLLRSEIPCSAPRIACTQPRRVAAISLAHRVAAEVGVPLGRQVGYTVRFDDKSTPATRLKYMTDGALLAEMLGDQDLDRYDVIVLDEAHERSLRTDMLMGFLKDIQARRRAKYEAALKSGTKSGGERGDERGPTPLKIVVMSATIDAERFSDFFGQ